MHTPPNPESKPTANDREGSSSEPLDRNHSLGGHTNGSTGDYRPTTPTSSHGSSLVELFGSSFVRLTVPDILADAPDNSDDFPTIITQNKVDTGSKPSVTGQKLGHFELIETIGSGGMATVFKARDLELGRIVALKILPPETTRDSESVTRFKQEARAAAKLDHDNIARVYFCGEDRNLHFIAFEYVEGENLRQVIDKLGTVPAADCVRYMLQIAAGLGHAAERGVVHRDIKPSNIIITTDGRAKIVDMGLARHLESHSVNGGLTQSGVTLGTFDYISPEQAMDPRRADVRSDIYSLGCTFYHAITGRPPVPEGTAAKKLQAHQHLTPTDPRDLNPNVPDGLAVVLGKMMAKSPDRRYATPAELIRDLNALARDWNIPIEGTTAEMAALPFISSATPSAEPFRLPFGILAAVAGIVITVAILFGSSTSGPAIPQSAPPPWSELPNASTKPAVADTTPPVLPATDTSKKSRKLTTVKAVAEAITAKGAEELVVRLQPGTEYDLTTWTEPIIFTGTELTIEPEPSPTGDVRPPIIKLNAMPITDGVPRPGTLAVRDIKSVVLRGIDFRFVDLPLVGAPNTDPIGLLFSHVGRIEIEACRFRAATETRRNRTVAIRLDDEPGMKPAELSVRHALFDLGSQSIAIEVPARTKVDVREVAFAPHTAAIHLLGEADNPTGEVKLQQCTFMLDRGGVAIEADSLANAKVTASACAFAEAMPSGASNRGLSAVLHAADVVPLVQFGLLEGGQPNGYFAVTTPIGDAKPILLVRSPWVAADPRRLLVGDEPWNAFKLNILTDRKLGMLPPIHVLGAKAILGPTLNDMIYKVTDGVPSWPPPRAQLAVVAKANELIVFPEAEPEDAANRIYPAFETAWSNLKPGDTLLVAVNGRVPVPPLPEKKLKATIKPYPNFTPVLVPEGTPRFRDASMFPHVEGELTFSGLRIQLSQRQSVVTIAGGRECSFKDCLITLEKKDDERDDDTPTVVAFPDPSREMRMNSDDPVDGPKVLFLNTLVRGHGRAVWAKAARPFDLTIEQSAFVLDGSFLWVDPAAKESNLPPPKAIIKWKQATTILSGALFDIQAGRANAGPPTFLSVEAERSLFAPSERRRMPTPLIVIKEAEPLAEPKAFLSWQSLAANVYGNYERGTLLELRHAAADATPPTELDADKWLAFAKDSGRSTRVKFPNGTLNMKLLVVKPADLIAKFADDSTDVTAGVDATKLPKDEK